MDAMLPFLVLVGAYSRSFCELKGASTVNTFSSLNHMKSMTWCGNCFSSCSQRIRRSLRFASDSSLTLHALESQITMNTTHRRPMYTRLSSSCDQTNSEVCLRLIFLTKYQFFDFLNVVDSPCRARSDTAFLQLDCSS